MEDDFTLIAAKGISYRLVKPKLGDALHGQGKIDVVRQRRSRKDTDVGHEELRVDEQTRIWKGDKQAHLTDLVIGDELLANFTGTTAEHRGRCSEIWAGAETIQRTASANESCTRLF